MKIIKPRWLFTARIERFKVSVGKIGRRWLVARTRNPRFCFEGTSVVNVKRKAQRAIRFYLTMKNA